MLNAQAPRAPGLMERTVRYRSDCNTDTGWLDRVGTRIALASGPDLIHEPRIYTINPLMSSVLIAQQNQSCGDIASSLIRTKSRLALYS